MTSRRTPTRTISFESRDTAMSGGSGSKDKPLSTSEHSRTYQASDNSDESESNNKSHHATKPTTGGQRHRTKGEMSTSTSSASRRKVRPHNEPHEDSHGATGSEEHRHGSSSTRRQRPQETAIKGGRKTTTTSSANSHSSTTNKSPKSKHKTTTTTITGVESGITSSPPTEKSSRSRGGSQASSPTSSRHRKSGQSYSSNNNNNKHSKSSSSTAKRHPNQDSSTGVSIIGADDSASFANVSVSDLSPHPYNPKNLIAGATTTTTTTITLSSSNRHHRSPPPPIQQQQPPPPEQQQQRHSHTLSPKQRPAFDGDVSPRRDGGIATNIIPPGRVHSHYQDDDNDHDDDDDYDNHKEVDSRADDDDEEEEDQSLQIIPGERFSRDERQAWTGVQRTNGDAVEEESLATRDIVTSSSERGPQHHRNNNNQNNQNNSHPLSDSHSSFYSYGNSARYRTERSDRRQRSFVSYPDDGGGMDSADDDEDDDDDGNDEDDYNDRRRDTAVKRYSTTQDDDDEDDMPSLMDTSLASASNEIVQKNHSQQVMNKYMNDVTGNKRGGPTNNKVTTSSSSAISKDPHRSHSKMDHNHGKRHVEANVGSYGAIKHGKNKPQPVSPIEYDDNDIRVASNVDQPRPRTTDSCATSEMDLAEFDRDHMGSSQDLLSTDEDMYSQDDEEEDPLPPQERQGAKNSTKAAVRTVTDDDTEQNDEREDEDEEDEVDEIDVEDLLYRSPPARFRRPVGRKPDSPGQHSMPSLATYQETELVMERSCSFGELGFEESVCGESKLDAERLHDSDGGLEVSYQSPGRQRAIIATGNPRIAVPAMKTTKTKAKAKTKSGVSNTTAGAKTKKKKKIPGKKRESGVKSTKGKKKKSPAETPKKVEEVKPEVEVTPDTFEELFKDVVNAPEEVLPAKGKVSKGMRLPGISAINKFLHKSPRKMKHRETPLSQLRKGVLKLPFLGRKKRKNTVDTGLRDAQFYPDADNSEESHGALLD